MIRDIDVLFEAEYRLEDVEEPYDSAVVKQLLQDALGFTGITVTDVLTADGASDL